YRALHAVHSFPTRRSSDLIEEADRLRNLVDRMLGSNKLPSLGMTNIHEVLEHVASLIEAESQGRIIMARDYDPSIPEVLADRERSEEHTSELQSRENLVCR